MARDAVEHELERLDQAIRAAGDEIEHNRQAVSSKLGEQYGAIFSAHLQMLRDPALRTELDAMIRERHYSPEYAVSRALRRYAKVFQTIDSSYLAERANDIFDIEKRLLRNLLGRNREELSQLTSPVVVLAHNLTPSETANLNRAFVRGFATEVGGPGSHTAIVAEGLEIPAVVGTGPFLTDVSGGDLVIIDGDHGLVILQPDEETIAHYRHEAEQNRQPGRATGNAPRTAGRNGRRRAHRTVRQYRVSARGQPLRRTRRRRHRAVSHRVSLPGLRTGTRRSHALRGLRQGHERNAGPPGRDPHLRPGRRQSFRR